MVSQTLHLVICLYVSVNTINQNLHDTTEQVLCYMKSNLTLSAIHCMRLLIKSKCQRGIFVSYLKKDSIVAVDRLGVFRYVYPNNNLDVGSVANDSKGLVS